MAMETDPNGSFGEDFGGGFGENFGRDFAHTPLRLLWDNGSGSAALWQLEAGRKTPEAPLILGPFTRWTARGLAVGAAGESFLLWTEPEGRASVWRVGPGGAEGHVEFGPYPGWETVGVSVGPDGIVRLLWRGPEGTAALWRLRPELTAEETPSVCDYGPYPGWTATALSVGADRRVHLLWTHADGEANLWRLDASRMDGEASLEHAPADSQTRFGPYEDWTALAVAAGAEGTSRLLWRKAGGLASLWTVPADGSAASGSPDTQTQAVQGPCESWQALGATALPGGGASLLWGRKSGGLASVWQLDADGEAVAHTEHGPYSGWVPVALAAG